MEEKYTVQTCSVCKHPERDQIENELITRSRTQKEICQIYGLREASLSNHKNKHMLLNMRERLKMIVQKAIMDGLEPDNVGELIRLIEYVDKMESETFLDAQRQWSESFIEKMACFKNMILEQEFFNDIPTETRRQIIVSAESCFGKSGPRDVGEFAAKMLGLKVGRYDND